MVDRISKQQKILHFEVFLQNDRRYYRRYLDNSYMKVHRPKSVNRVDIEEFEKVVDEKEKLILLKKSLPK